MMKVKGNDLESRVQRLERENRTLKSVGLGLALLALLVVGTAQAPGRAPKVEASEIVLKDDAGTVRARFAVDSVGSFIELLDRYGNRKIAASANLGSSGIVVTDSASVGMGVEAGTAQVLLSYEPLGVRSRRNIAVVLTTKTPDANASPGVIVSTADRTGVAMLGARSGRGASLVLSGEGASSALINAAPAGPTFVLMDPSYNKVFRAP